MSSMSYPPDEVVEKYTTHFKRYTNLVARYAENATDLAKYLCVLYIHLSDEEKQKLQVHWTMHNNIIEEIAETFSLIADDFLEYTDATRTEYKRIKRLAKSA